jgi:hypothetical protein
MFRVLGIGAAMVLALLSISGSVAEDRDEFYAIARGESGRRAAPASGGLFGWQRRVEAPAPAASPVARRQMTRSRQAAALAGTDRSSRTFCVRSCDGYYFPVGPVTSGAGRHAQADACNAMCPGATVRLYSARNGAIETARSETGQVYGATATAFRYRERLQPGCSCQASATQGLARLALAQDYTLRHGDVVVMAAGVRIFRGAGRFPHQPRDFVTARTYGRLSPDLRRRVAEIETARLPVRVQRAGIATASTSDTFARAPRLDGLREMMAIRGPVRQIAIARAVSRPPAPRATTRRSATR